MNLHLFSRILAVVIAVFVSNVKADVLHRNMEKIFVPMGSFLIDEEKTKILIGDRLSPRERIIVGKAIMGGVGHFMKHKNFEGDRMYIKSDKYFVDGINPAQQRIPYCVISSMHAVGYVAVNGSLRYVGEKCSLNEEYIDQKCDEYLPESIAWVAKPIANIAVDLVYDYVTVQLLKRIVYGHNQTRQK